MIFEADCIARDGHTNLYKFHILQEGRIYRVNIANEDGTPNWGIITFTFTFFDENTLHFSNMYIENDDYKMKGIPEAVIIGLARKMKKTIVSSTQLKDNGEHLHEPAKKVWERLVNKKLVYFDENLERFKTKINGIL
ncbi:hypothetical protein [Sulfurimonas sp.]|uniref:hypothetical protein n=1 Tax=Sulfurimonas sp. TaxID=2022749 RepID=UPI00261A9798|nr:hypothetical protein [Sulfurimonas sp.]MDD3856072.1 hypothetical protein [Sulfurimonas sp.]